MNENQNMIIHHQVRTSQEKCLPRVDDKGIQGVLFRIDPLREPVDGGLGRRVCRVGDRSLTLPAKGPISIVSTTFHCSRPH